MSQVRVRERHDSKILYVDNARELVIHTIQYCRKFPKSAMFFITKDLVDTSRAIYKNVACTQAVFPKTPQDIELRAKFLKTALGLIDTLDCFLGIAKELYGNLTDKNGKSQISDYGWVHWGELLSKESNYIKRVLTSDEAITF